MTAVRLAKQTDLALRILIQLAVMPEGASLPAIAAANAQSVNHMKKIAVRLARAGLLTPTRGRAGGYRLSRAAEEIGIGEVVRLMEPDFAVVECFQPAAERCRIVGACGLVAMMSEATEAFLAVLDRHTLGDAARRPAALRSLLAVA